MARKMGFSYVFIPHESHRPMEERYYPDDVGLENDQFIESLKSHFANSSSSSADPAMLRQHMAQHAGKEAMDKLTDDMMEKLLFMTTVDIFPLMMPTQKTEFLGISIYVDDKGVSKNLPLNERATSLAHNCGYMDQRFVGDAFIARIFDDQDAWQRKDIKLTEINSDAPWIALVHEQRKNKSSTQSLHDLKNMLGGAGGAGGNIMTPGLPAITEENNSGSTDVYEWREENKEEIEVTFKQEVTDKKKVKVNFSQKKLSATYDGKELLNAELCKAVDPDDCSWSIIDKTKLQVTLMKKDAALWGSLLAQ